MRRAKSGVEELQQRLKQRVEAHVPLLFILGLAMFSVGVAKAYNRRIALMVFIVLTTIFAIGYRLVQKLFGPSGEEKPYNGNASELNPSHDSAEIKRPQRRPVISEDVVSNNEGKRTA